MEQPIACSLDEASAAGQLDEWRALLAASVTAVEWPEPDLLRFVLRPDTDVAALSSLAQREAACCPFFSFALEIDHEEIAFVTAVPEDARPILVEFAKLADR